VRSDIERVVRIIEKEYGGLDVLVNNAGVKESILTGGRNYLIEDLPIDVWDTVIETNLRGAFLCTHAMLPLLGRSGGRIIHLTSGMGREGRSKRSAYVASKFGLEGLHESLADEFDDTNVESILLDPGGGVDTDGFSGHLDEEERNQRLDPSIVIEPALQLAEGYGRNGGRYVATEMNNSET
jgi:3-oxoacyl-[acyl-carrier protein] reductase